MNVEPGRDRRANQDRDCATWQGATLGPQDVLIERRTDGSMLLRSPQKLGPYPDKITERLEHWAKEAPDRVLFAQRDATGAWRKITYAQALQQARSIGQALLARNLSPERPIAILSGNGIEHALLGAWRFVCRHSLCADLAGLFAGLE